MGGVDKVVGGLGVLLIRWAWLALKGSQAKVLHLKGFGIRKGEQRVRKAVEFVLIAEAWRLIVLVCCLQRRFFFFW